MVGPAPDRAFLWRLFAGAILLVAICALAQYLLFEQHAPVGAYIAFLGVIAAMATAREHPSKVEKAAWIVSFTALGLLEILNIYRDSAEREVREQDAQTRQANAFKDIADGLKTSIQNSQQQFAITMDGVTNTLKASEKAALNSRPIADMNVVQILPYAPSLPMKAGSKIVWNVGFHDVGTATARNVKRMGKMYFGKPDNKDDQLAIAKAFDQEWSKASPLLSAYTINPGDPLVFTLESDTVSDQQVSRVRSGENTIYLLVRFAWTDGTGRWARDWCEGFQDPNHDLQMGHPCVVHNRERYRFGN